jgi:rhodanese-related sulfurtransferase
MKQDIQPRDLQRRLASGEHLRIVDVRSSLEFAGGHLPGALNIPLGNIENEIPGVEASEHVVIVCHSGMRSSIACQKVMGSHKVLFNLVGGTSAWKSAGFEVESGPKAPRSIDRQTHLVAGGLLVASFLLSRGVSPGWIYLALLPTFGLLLDAFTGICPMTLILKQMPWNQMPGNASLKQTT